MSKLFVPLADRKHKHECERRTRYKGQEVLVIEAVHIVKAERLVQAQLVTELAEHLGIVLDRTPTNLCHVARWIELRANIATSKMSPCTDKVTLGVAVLEDLRSLRAGCGGAWWRPSSSWRRFVFEHLDRFFASPCLPAIHKGADYPSDIRFIRLRNLRKTTQLITKWKTSISDQCGRHRMLRPWSLPARRWRRRITRTRAKKVN